MTKAEQRKRAVKLTLPVFCGYIVLGIAFGATLAQAGYGPVWALAISTLVYAGSLQFVMVPFLAGGTSLIAVALIALMVNARHLFYGLSCIERFGRMDKRIRPYMITSLTDETYSVFCGLSGDEEDGVMFRVTLYDQIYWVIGSILGTLLAQGLPFDLTGIDFSMTALFVGTAGQCSPVCVWRGEAGGFFLVFMRRFLHSGACVSDHSPACFKKTVKSVA